jgi:hypothetical protein
MSIATEKITIDCPQCGKALLVPANAAGKKVRCAACQNTFSVEAPVTAVAVEQFSPQSYLPQPASPGLAPSAAVRQHGGKANSWAERRLNAGVKGGVTMIAIAVVWFAAGLLLLDRVFVYPPILFVFGLISFCRGLR